MEKNLLLCNGKDYWLIPRFERKEIITINVQSKCQVIYTFESEKLAKENYKLWLENSDARLPRSFLIRSKDYNVSMIKTLSELGIKKERKSELKKYLFFHLYETTWTCSHIEDINRSIIPTLKLSDLKDILKRKKEINSVIQKRMSSGVGLFHEI